ncbi:hypothetical protein OIO90_003645 [Microbotryomycetes sp. JL221]|nr:hypothetical protein OIO90_003645 [Microbotryomycetes sp. JL221]
MTSVKIEIKPKAKARRGRKQDDSLPPSRSRDMQRAFRARRAAHLELLEAKVDRLERENNELRQRLGMPPRPPTPELTDDGTPIANDEPQRSQESQVKPSELTATTLSTTNSDVVHQDSPAIQTIRHQSAQLASPVSSSNSTKNPKTHTSLVVSIANQVPVNHSRQQQMTHQPFVVPYSGGLPSLAQLRAEGWSTSSTQSQLTSTDISAASSVEHHRTIQLAPMYQQQFYKQSPMSPVYSQFPQFVPTSSPQMMAIQTAPTQMNSNTPPAQSMRLDSSHDNNTQHEWTLNDSRGHQPSYDTTSQSGLLKQTLTSVSRNDSGHSNQHQRQLMNHSDTSSCIVNPIPTPPPTVIAPHNDSQHDVRRESHQHQQQDISLSISSEMKQMLIDYCKIDSNLLSTSSSSISLKQSTVFENEIYIKFLIQLLNRLLRSTKFKQDLIQIEKDEVELNQDVCCGGYVDCQGPLFDSTESNSASSTLEQQQTRIEHIESWISIKEAWDLIKEACHGIESNSKTCTNMFSSTSTSSLNSSSLASIVNEVPMGLSTTTLVNMIFDFNNQQESNTFTTIDSSSSITTRNETIIQDFQNVKVNSKQQGLIVKKKVIKQIEKTWQDVKLICSFGATPLGWTGPMVTNRGERKCCAPLSTSISSTPLNPVEG